MANSKNSFELIAFLWRHCEYTRRIFTWIWVVRRQIVTNLALSSEEFSSFLAFFSWVFDFFQQFYWPFLAFVTEGLGFFEKINLATLFSTCRWAVHNWSVFLQGYFFNAWWRPWKEKAAVKIGMQYGKLATDSRFSKRPNWKREISFRAVASAVSESAVWLYRSFAT